MFERFEDRARRVLVAAQEEALRLEHHHIGADHLLLGLLADPTSPAGAALQDAGVTADAVRERVVARRAGGTEPKTGSPPFSPEAKKALELSLRSALELHDGFIGPEHLLLGILRQPDDPAVGDLAALGVDVDLLRTTVIATRPGPAPQGTTPASVATGVLFTPAARSIFSAARRSVGSGALGSQHLLLAVFDDPDSAASKTLAALGITREAVERAIAPIDVDGTTDAV